MQQSGGKLEVEAFKAQCPEMLHHLWQWFLELHSERGSNGFGPSRITSTAIKDWCWSTGNKPAKWEIAVLKQLDSKWLAAQPKPKTDK